MRNAIRMLGLLALGVYPASTLAETPPASATTVSGLLDLYYSFNFNRPPSLSLNSGGLPDAQTNLRNFDQFHNQFGLNLAEVSIRHSQKQASLRIDLDVGDLTDFLHKNGTSTDEVTKHVGQAFVTYSPASVSGLTFSVGKMLTHVDWEGAKAKDNWQYSRSFLFALGSPYWHLGASMSYALLPGTLVTNLYVYNGWNTTYDTNDAKTLGAQATWTPADSLTLTYNFLSGSEGTSASSVQKTLQELIGVWKLSGSVSLAADLLNGWTPDARWMAGTLAAKFAVSSDAYLSPRLELYSDPQGVTSGLPQDLTSITLTWSQGLADGLEYRIEGRLDQSTQNAFVTASGTTNSQTTTTGSLLYSF